MEEERELTVTERIMLETDDIYTGSPSAEQEISDAQLHVEPWNRTTIADGLWLQENAIAPFSARDIMLANEIDKTNERVSELEEAATDGREVRSFSPRVWSGDDTSWHNIHNTRVIPDDELIPKNSIMYMPMVYSSSTHGETSEGGVLSMNSKNKSFQLEINETGVFWDFGDPNNTTTNVNGDYGSFEVDTKSGKHSMKILTEADKKDLDDKFWLLTSAGYEKKGLGDTLAWDSDGNLVLSNFPSDWAKTVNGEIDLPAIEGADESYMHGDRFTLAGDFKLSTLVASQGSLSGSSKFANILAYSPSISANITDAFASLHSLYYTSERPEYSPLKIDNSVAILQSQAYTKDNKIVDSIVNVHSAGTLEPSASIEKSVAILNNMSPNDANVVGSYVNLHSATLASGCNVTDSLINGSSINLSGDYEHDIVNLYSSSIGGVGNVIKHSLLMGHNHNEIHTVERSIINGNWHWLQGYCTDSIFMGYCNYVPNGQALYNSIIDAKNTSAANNYVLALGEYMHVKGSYSLSLGSQIDVWTNKNVAVGDGGKYCGNYNFGAGTNLSADGSHSLLLGSNNLICTNHSGIVNGTGNFMYGAEDVVMGDNNKIGEGSSNAIFGDSNSAHNASNTLIMGNQNMVNGDNIILAGEENSIASDAYYDCIIGESNSASKTKYSIIAGLTNNVYANYGVAVGFDNELSAANAVAFGRGHRPGRAFQVCFGQYTVGLSDSLLEVGVGTSDGGRNTIFRIDSAGNVYCTGKVYADSLESNSSWTNKMVHP